MYLFGLKRLNFACIWSFEGWLTPKIKIFWFHLAKGGVFFFFREKFVFSHFWSKIVWVSKKAVFFFPPPEKKNRLFRRVSEWILTFPGKKKQEKKNKKKTDPWKKRKACTNFSKSLEMSFEEEIVHIYSYI